MIDKAAEAGVSAVFQSCFKDEMLKDTPISKKFFRKSLRYFEKNQLNN